ncbi:UDP-N-acetylmuramate dehydrogenase [Rhodocyclaceae bacterium SMB388]
MPTEPESVPPIRTAVDLTPLNTFGLRARATRLVVIERAEQLRSLIARPGWAEQARLVLGGGSNLVLTGDFPGLVIKVEIAGRALVDEDAEARYVRAGAGENWHAFVRWTLAQGWGGLENLSLIPGTVGASPIQNIGAYGVELEERFHSLDAISFEDGRMRRFERADCAFGYRDSVFKHAEAGRWVIVSVTFRLPRRWQAITGYGELARELEGATDDDPTAQQVSDAVIAIRRRKLPDPAEIGNAGSFFKNPIVAPDLFEALIAQNPAMPHYMQPDGSIKLAAGWLIDACGWKGRNLGPVGCFERQALVLVNRGGACGADVLRIASAIQHDVERRFGLRLEPEPVLI